jgi:hypothetical protein
MIINRLESCQIIHSFDVRLVFFDYQTSKANRCYPTGLSNTQSSNSILAIFYFKNASICGFKLIWFFK